MNLKQSFRLTVATCAVTVSLGACSPLAVIPTSTPSDVPTTGIGDALTVSRDDRLLCRDTLHVDRATALAAGIDIETKCVAE